MSGTLNVAVIQSPAELNGPQARLAWLTQALEDHANQPCDLVVLPELFQSGYNVGNKVAEYAEPSDGPFARAVADLAKKHGTAILYGYSERQGDALFNSAQCIDKNGQVIGHHRKLLLPPGFEGDHFAPGNGCELFTLGEFKIGILVCYDFEFPENLRYVALQGADLVTVPTALGAQWGVVSEKVVPTRAFENGVYVCYANSCGQENGMNYFGGSCIISPDGSDLARAKSGSEFLHSCIKKSAVAIAQDRLPYHKDRQKLPWI
jgi:predicted amidohydrolase